MPVGEPYSNGPRGNGSEHVSIWADGTQNADINQMQSIVLKTAIAPQMIARNRIFLGHAAGGRSQSKQVEGEWWFRYQGFYFRGR